MLKSGTLIEYNECEPISLVNSRSSNRLALELQGGYKSKLNGVYENMPHCVNSLFIVRL